MPLRQLLGDAIKRTILNSGFVIHSAASAHKALSAIRRYHPVQTNSDLIRVGGRHDGGYLLPDDLEGVVACFSPGVALTATFEEDMIARGIPCYLADASVEAAPIASPLIRFRKKFIGPSTTGDYITIQDWINEEIGDAPGDLMLQMDIEGHEYAALLSTPREILKRFRIIVLELHYIDRAADEFGETIIWPALDRLTHDFHVVHLHPNNHTRGLTVEGTELPRYLEMTLYRKDRSPAVGYVSEFPHPLDEDCVPTKQSVVLGPGWYRSGGKS